MEKAAGLGFRVNSSLKRHFDEVDQLKANDRSLKDVVNAVAYKKFQFSHQQLPQLVMPPVQAMPPGSDNRSPTTSSGDRSTNTDSPLSGAEDAPRDNVTPPPHSEKRPMNELPKDERDPVSGLILPDLSAFGVDMGSSAPKIVCPKTPMRKVAMDAFRTHLKEMLEDQEIVINGEIVEFERWLGEGNFREVFLLENGQVAKIPIDLEFRTQREIMGKNASAERQYRLLLSQSKELAKLGLLIAPTVFRADGVILQPFSRSLACEWNEATLLVDLSVGQRMIIDAAKAIFSHFYRVRIPIDFKPDNVYLSENRLVLRDFYELEDHRDRFSDLVGKLLPEWARGSREIYNYLDPRPKAASASKD